MQNVSKRKTFFRRRVRVGGWGMEGGWHFLDPMIAHTRRLRLKGVPFLSFSFIKRSVILELKNTIAWENQSFKYSKGPLIKVFRKGGLMALSF